MTQRVHILGANGKIGRHSATAFKAAGWEVRTFDRKTDRMTAVAQGCDVIVNGMNPPNYHNWKQIIPQITAQVIEAAQHSGATVILPGNVYHFGDQPGLWSEATPPQPVSLKGRIRLEMEQAYAGSGVQTILLRAGNFMDPDHNDCVLSQIHLRKIDQGKITLAGPADTRQAMCFLPDWARAAVALADMRGSLDVFQDIPFEGHTLSARDIKNGLEPVLKRDLTFTPFPWWVFRIASPVWELARELNEMRYLWHTDHALSGERMKELLPDFQSTAIDHVLKQMTRQPAC